jgi:hypothetical protein
MKDIIQINEFFVEGKNSSDSHVLLHISEPSFEEDGQGYFFALCEIKNGNTNIIGQIQKMIDDVESLYYEEDTEEKKKNAFEYSIDQINLRSHHILKDLESTLDLTFGVIEKNKIFIASRGNIHSTLLYHKQGEIKHIRIKEDQEPSLEQVFPSLIEGEIKNNDYFVLTTENTEKIFPLDRIEKILPQKDNKATAWHIQKTLEQMEKTVSLGGIIIHKPTADQIPRITKLPKVAKPIQASLPENKNFFSSTLEKISESLNKNNVVENTIFNPKTKPFLESERAKIPAEKQVPQIILSLANGIAFTGAMVIRILRMGFNVITSTFRFLFFIITNKGGQRQKALHQFQIGMHDKIRSFKNLPILSKVFLFLSILAIALFIGSIIYHNKQVLLSNQQEEYNLTLEKIKKQKDTADRSILYGDTKTAFTALQEAKQKTEGLLSHPNKSETELQSLLKDFENSLSQIRKQNDAPSIQKADIKILFPNTQTEKIVRLGNLLFAFGADDKFAYTVNLDTGEILQKNHDTINPLSIGNSPKEYNKIVFPLDATHIAEYNKENDSLSSKDISYPKENPNISSLFIYNLKLYTLDTKNNQIYRHNQTAGGYDKGTPWIAETGVDLSDAVSLSIDGDLYLLKKNGTIQKFTAGVAVPFSTTAIDPPLKNPTEIWTYTDIKNIYILDPGTKRVLAIDKSGNLVKQYSSSEWQNPTSMVVDEPGKKIYLLDNGKILEFKI